MTPPTPPSAQPRGLKWLADLGAVVLVISMLAAGGMAGLFALQDLRAAAGERKFILAARATDPQILAELGAEIAEGLERGPRTWHLHELASRVALYLPPVDAETGRQELLAALAISPGRGDLWARLATVDLHEFGHLTPNGTAALERSFLVSPFGRRSLQFWRVEFALMNFATLTEDTKTALNQGLSAVMQTPHGRGWLEERSGRLHDEDARLFIAMALEADAD